MKIYISIQNDNGSKFLEIDVSESITAKEVLELSEVKRFYQQEMDLLRVGINGEELDGKYKAHPINYRMSHGERNVCQDVIPTPCPCNELQLKYILKNLSLIYKLIMGHEVYSNRHHVGHYI